MAYFHINRIAKASPKSDLQQRNGKSFATNTEKLTRTRVSNAVGCVKRCQLNATYVAYYQDSNPSSIRQQRCHARRMHAYDAATPEVKPARSGWSNKTVTSYRDNVTVVLLTCGSVQSRFAFKVTSGLHL
jgi:hypothetical protein